MLQCFSFYFSILLSSRVSYIICLPLNDLGPPLVDRPSHYLSACPIGHPHKPSVNLGDQDSTVQGSSPHKCGQKVSCKTFKCGSSSFFLDISWLPFVLYIRSAYPYQQNFLEYHFGRQNTLLTSISFSWGDTPPRPNSRSLYSHNSLVKFKVLLLPHHWFILGSLCLLKQGPRPNTCLGPRPHKYFKEYKNIFQRRVAMIT